jgi:hypothetical protein
LQSSVGPLLTEGELAPSAISKQSKANYIKYAEKSELKNTNRQARRNDKKSKPAGWSR